jgi:hypothetical protein
MGNLLQTGAAWLAGVHKLYAGQAVTYSRGAASVAWTATLGKTEFQRINSAGVVTTFTSRDFLGLAADLILDGQPATPRAGDRITEDGEVYEVMDLGGEQPWRWSDPYKVRLRIHTKRVDTEE